MHSENASARAYKKKNYLTGTKLYVGNGIGWRFGDTNTTQTRHKLWVVGEPLTRDICDDDDSN